MQLETDGDHETGYYQYRSTPAPETPSTPRNRDDLEVIEMELSEVVR